MWLGCRSAHEFLAPKRPVRHYGFFVRRQGQKGYAPNTGFYTLIFSIKTRIKRQLVGAEQCCRRKAGAEATAARQIRPSRQRNGDGGILDARGVPYGYARPFRNKSSLKEVRHGTSFLGCVRI